MSKTRSGILALFLLAATFAGMPQAIAEEFHCEVLGLRGKVTATSSAGEERSLSEGDLVSPGETVMAEEMSSVDLAFDKEWKNIVHVDSGTSFEVVSVYPSKLKQKEGAMFAKLKSLPKDSSFEVKTPTAVATVRGTEYRTTFQNGQTQVYNVSPSPVFVYGLQEDGSVNLDRQVILEQSKKTQIEKAGEVPQPPKDITEEEIAVTDAIKTAIDEKVQEVEASGRVSKILSVKELENSIFEEEKKPEVISSSPLAEPNDTDESRVTDLRRRPFKKVE